VFALAALAMPGCEGGFDPFALKNTDFLLTLGLTLVAAICVGRVARSMLRTPNPQPQDEDVQLDWAQTAYLAGGAGRLTTATIAQLVGDGQARVSLDGTTLTAAGPWPDNASAVEKAVLRSLPVKNEVTALKPVQDAVEIAFAKRAEQMKEDGWTLSGWDQFRIWLASMVPLVLVMLCLATPRLVMGVQGKHPTNYLVTEMIVGGLLGLIILGAGTWRLSNRGIAILEQQKKRNEPLRASTQWKSEGDAGMAVALFGTAVLVGTVFAPLQTWYPRQTGESSSSGCSTGSGCGSGCGGGGDGGGGGCGGGGCGGGGD
jgi:uncharacterized protein (TIGR04222 family)